MPHSIRDYFLNSNNHHHASGNPHTRNNNAASSTSGGTSSTSYTVSSSSPPTYPYTYRFLHRPTQQSSVASSSPSIVAAAITTSSGTSMSQPGSVPRMPQYRPPQNQHHANGAAPATSSNNNSSSSGSSSSGGNSGVGYRTTYYGSGYNSQYTSSSNGSNGTHSKTVCRMDCRYCSAVICLRGMKAMLLADTSVELYSTDHPPGSVQLIDKDYTTSNCKCKIRDVACRVCGNVVGYHITQPCQQCLKAPNNGHFWMFHTEGVIGQERLSLDLGKLVQKLVKCPHATRQPHATTTTATTTATAATSPVSGSTESQSHSESMTARLASISPSPGDSTPSTPTPSSVRANTAEAVNAATTPATPSTTATDDEPDVVVPSAAATLATLSVTQFLQPMKWEQLPPPDIDIDLDPASMGDEPLFADQWVDLVMKTTETAAANMCLALDQEEETERFLERMVETRQLELEEEVAVGEGSDETPELNLNGEPTPLQATQQREGPTIEQLIDQVDEFGLSTPSPAPNVGEDLKEDEYPDLDTNSDPMDRNESGSLESRQRNAQPDAAPAPGLQGPTPSPSTSEATFPELFNSSNNRVPQREEPHDNRSAQSASSVSCPPFALTSAMAAQASASAAASDAASAANSLLYSRRGRREYEMMCR